MESVFYDIVNHHICDTTLMPLVFIIIVVSAYILLGRCLNNPKQCFISLLTIGAVANIILFYFRIFSSLSQDKFSFSGAIQWLNLMGEADAPSYGWWVDYWPSWSINLIVYRLYYCASDFGSTCARTFRSETSWQWLDSLNPWTNSYLAALFFYDPAIMLCFGHNTYVVLSSPGGLPTSISAIDMDPTVAINAPVFSTKFFKTLPNNDGLKKWLRVIAILEIVLELYLWGPAVHDWIVSGHCGLEGFASYNNPVNFAVFSSITVGYFANLVSVLTTESSWTDHWRVRMALLVVVSISFYNATIASALILIIISFISSNKSTQKNS